MLDVMDTQCNTDQYLQLCCSEALFKNRHQEYRHHQSSNANQYSNARQKLSYEQDKLCLKIRFILFFSVRDGSLKVQQEKEALPTGVRIEEGGADIPQTITMPRCWAYNLLKRCLSLQTSM